MDQKKPSKRSLTVPGAEHSAIFSFAAIIFLITIWHAIEWPIPGYDGDTYQFLQGIMHLEHAGPNQLLTDPSDVLRATSHGGRPPLYQILAWPLVSTFGRTEESAIAVNGFFYLLLIFSVFRIGSMVASAKAGLLAAIVSSTYGPVVMLSHTFLPVSALPACVALSTFLLLKVLRKRQKGSIWLFGGSLALGLLVHPQFLWVAIPLAAFAVSLISFYRGEDSLAHPDGLRPHFDLIFLGFFPAGLFWAAIVSAWFLTIGTSQLELYLSIDDGSALRGARLVAHMFKEVEPSPFWYLETAPRVITNFFAGLLLAGIVATCFSRNIERWILLGVGMAAFALLSFQTTLDWIYMAQLLPIFGLVSTVWIPGLTPRWHSALLVSACLLVSAFNLIVATLGVTNHSREIAELFGLCPESGYTRSCIRPLSSGEKAFGKSDAPERDILAAIFESGDCDTRTCSVTYLNIGGSPRFQYYLALDFPDKTIRFQGVGSHLWGSDFGFVALLDHDFIVYPRKAVYKSSHPGALYQNAATEFLTRPAKEFAQRHEDVSSFSFQNIDIVLVRRAGPLTSIEARSVVSAVQLDEKHKKQGYELLVQLLRKEKKTKEASGVCEVAQKQNGYELRQCLDLNR